MNDIEKIKMTVPRKTDVYSVVHFGTKTNPVDIPIFMKEDGLFTTNVRKAYFTTSRDDAEILACRINTGLEQEHHELAGRVMPVSFCVADPDYETARFEKRDNVEGLSFWWFTFGCGHPLADMVQGVYATDEEKARETMLMFYGRNWCSCYRANDPQCENDIRLVRIGSREYRPILRFLKEGDCY